MDDHSLIAPSSAHVWGAPGGCRAYPLMAAMYPDEETEESRIGDATHELGAETVLQAARVGHVADPTVSEYTGTNGVTLEPEHIECAITYGEYCASIMRAEGVFGGPMLRVEERVFAPQIHSESHGTPDFSLFNRDVGRLHIVDLKSGRDLVDVFENWSLVNYFAGLVNKYEIDGYIDQELEVIFTIVQPRGFHPDGPIRTWRVLASDLRGMVNQLRSAAHECFGPDPVLRSGPHCRYCPARLNCPTAQRAGLSIYESAMSMQTHEMTPEAVGLQLLVVDRAYRELKSLREALESQVEALTRQGSIVPHWALEPATGRRKWTSEENAIAVADLYDVNIRQAQACTPLQAIDKGLKESVVMELSQQPRTGFKIVPDTTTKAKKVFS